MKNSVTIAGDVSGIGEYDFRSYGILVDLSPMASYTAPPSKREMEQMKNFYFKSGLIITVPGNPNCWLCQDRDWEECGWCPECHQPGGALWFWAI